MELRDRATLLREKGDLEGAVRACEEVLELEEVSWADLLEAQDLNFLGNLLSEKGAPREAIESYLKAAAIYRRHGDHEEMAKNLCNVALLHDANGNFTEAAKYYEKGIEAFELAENHREAARISYNAAESSKEARDLEGAVSWYRKCFDAYEKLGDDEGKAMALAGAGFAHQEFGNLATALKRFKQALGHLEGVESSLTEVIEGALSSLEN
ncbi:MAG: tetratricopeptide repeat protein [Promethearchaeota archaeon]